MTRIRDELGYGVRLRDQVRDVSIEAILEEFGWPMVARLIACARGQLIVIPDQADVLAGALGLELAQQLCARFRGRRCLIPGNGSAFMDRRDEAVRADKRAGMKHSDLREKYQLNEHQLLNVLRMIEG